MKKIFFLTTCLIFSLLLAVQAQEGSTKIKIKVKDGNGRLIEKEYDSEEAFRNDPELKELGIDVNTEGGLIQMESKGNGNRIVIMQSKGGEPGGFSYSFDKDSDILMGDSLLYIFQGRFHPDSLPHPRVHAFSQSRMRKGELDSLIKERRVEIFALRDSLHELRREFREEHREEMKQRREEMSQHREEFRARMELMRERMKEMDVEMEEGTRIIIIQELSKEETEQLDNKKEGLQLNELRFYPNPSAGTLQLELEAKESGPVEIKLMEANTSQVVYETTRNMKAGEAFEESISLKNYQPGWYRLQVLQNNKLLNRKVIIK